jgi:hypothetical protein
VAELIKAVCAACGAKYRLPAETAGRTAKCKKCGSKFEIPREKNLEDTILDWLEDSDSDAEETADQPRVINMPKDPQGAEVARAMQGPIRIKSASPQKQ